MADTVRDSVLAAFNAQTQEKTDGTEGAGNKETETKETTESTTKTSEENETTEEDDDSVDETKNKEARARRALEILDILEDPARNRAFVKAIAANFEEETKGDSKKDTKEAAKTLIDELKDAVGEDNAYLLRPIMEVVNRVVAKSEEKILGTLNKIEQQRMQTDLANRYESFIERNEVSKEEQDLMQELAKDLPPSPELSLEKYLTKLRRVAKAELTEKQEKANRNKKIEENKKKTQFQTAGANNESLGKEKPIIKTPRDAVMAAIMELQGNKD